jgi:nicotinamide riboside kinase
MEEKFKQEPTDIIKIVLFGPESTGKTTLSEQLARHYNTVWVPEYAREYLQNKWNEERKTCEPKDLLPIAEGQMRLENKLSKKASKVLICDTDLLETKVYSEAYYVGHCDPILEKYAVQNTYDLYLLTNIDVPWVGDDLRDKPNERQRMFEQFKENLDKYDRNYITLEGNKKTRLKTAVDHIDRLIEEMNFITKEDVLQLHTKGISKNRVRRQLETFRQGIPYVELKKAAVIDDGILKFSKAEEKTLIEKFEQSKTDLSLLKFVPASGAASRMFKALFNFLHEYDSSFESLDEYFERTGDNDIRVFFKRLKDFPFYKIINERIEKKADTAGENLYLFVEELLTEDKLNFGFYPKGLLPFHEYSNFTVTPFEEHLEEGLLYARTGDQSKLHFTISEQHRELFEKEFENFKKRRSKSSKTVFNVDYSYQKASTDTIAVDSDNGLFRNADGTILFRPGGHGALIENLNEQNADIIFIKNIDNVVVSKNAEAVANSKKILAGVLIERQEKAFEYAKILDEGDVSKNQLRDIKLFLEEKLNVRFSITAYHTFSFDEKVKILKDKINRPIRICGMVKNEGEPGGGPFWITDSKKRISLQIIESAQIDMSNEYQKNIVAKATHFNPVDLVCGVRNYKGEKYNLLNFVDAKQGFITGKTKDGKALKALELPGLWNGAMAFWNTIFVEVPLVTFNPVKTVNDLLKPSHQAE